MYIHVYIPTHTYMTSVLISTHPNKHILANCPQRSPHLLLFPYNFPFDSFSPSLLRNSLVILRGNHICSRLTPSPQEVF